MARTVNFEIDQGADFVYSFDVRDDEGLPIDVSAYTGTSRAKKHLESNTYFDIAVTCDSEGVTMSVGRDVTVLQDAGDWVYDVKLLDSVSNTASFPIEGRIRIKARSSNT